MSDTPWTDENEWELEWSAYDREQWVAQGGEDSYLVMAVPSKLVRELERRCRELEQKVQGQP